MFWGLIMEPQKRYSQTVKRSFHVSMAAIDVYSSSTEPVQVMCGFENRKYLLCTLHKEELRQCALDLNFEVGDKVTFLTNGESHVHLTGYLHDNLADDEEGEEEEEEADSMENVSLSNVVDGKRPKKPASGDIGPPAKKTRTMQLLEELNSQGSDSEDDPEINLSDIIDDEDETTFLEEEDEDDEDEEGEEEEEGENGGEEAEDEEVEDEDMEAEDDSDDDEASPLSSDEEDEKPKMNGKAKKANEQQQKKELKPKEMAAAKEKPQKGNMPKNQKKTLEGGVVIEEIKLGNGQPAKTGKMVQVYYEGRFKNNNKMFDSSTKGNGFKFRLGKQEVIKGWDVGVAGMKVGGKRRIICPPSMGYGAKGSPPTIPPNSTLVFEVELKNVK